MRDVVVKRAQLYEVALPLKRPFRISGGTLATRRSLIVELEDDDGARGLGESAPFEAPFYSSETIASAKACLVDWLLPRALARPVEDPASLHALLTEGIRGNAMARAGVETAWWDLVATRSGVALADLVSQRLSALGVPPRWLGRSDVVECGIALGIPETSDVDEVRHDVEGAVRDGYRRVKLKVRPGWDVAPVRAAQEVVRASGKHVPLTVDANGAYDLARHRSELAELDALGLLYIEQPLPGEAFLDLVALSSELSTPICLDETLASNEVARQVLALQGPTVWNIKLQRVGGLEEACRIYASAVAAGVHLWAGTMPETGLGAHATLALACHAGFVYPSDLEPSARWYEPDTDLIELHMAADGTMAVPSARAPVDLAGALLVHQRTRP